MEDKNKNLVSNYHELAILLSQRDEEFKFISEENNQQEVRLVNLIFFCRLTTCYQIFHMSYFNSRYHKFYLNLTDKYLLFNNYFYELFRSY